MRQLLLFLWSKKINLLGKNASFKKNDYYKSESLFTFL